MINQNIDYLNKSLLDKDKEIDLLKEKLNELENSDKLKQNKIDTLYGIISSNKEQFENSIKELKKIIHSREDVVRTDWKFLESYINQNEIDKKVIQIYIMEKIKDSEKNKDAPLDLNTSVQLITTIHLPLFSISPDSLYVQTKNNERVLLTKREHSILYRLARNVNKEVSFQDEFTVDKNFKQVIFLIRKKLDLGHSIKKNMPFMAILYKE